ncbi:MAG: tetratricopeptide repeat protein, partial [Blastocatellia bacterium]
MNRTLLAGSLSTLTLALTISICSPAPAQQAAAQGKLDGILKKGDDLYKAGKFKEAIDSYKEALVVDPENDQAVGYIAYSYNKLHDAEQARVWMKRRLEIPGQSPSKKAQVLTDLTLLYWDEAHMEIATRLAVGSKNVKPEEAGVTKKFLAEGINCAQKAVVIAPRSIKGFNLLNLLYRASAATEPDQATRADLLAKADEALRKS